MCKDVYLCKYIWTPRILRCELVSLEWGGGPNNLTTEYGLYASEVIFFLERKRKYPIHTAVTKH